MCTGFHVFQHILICIRDDKLVLEDFDPRPNGEVLGSVELWPVWGAAWHGHTCPFKKLSSKDSSISVSVRMCVQICVV